MPLAAGTRLGPYEIQSAIGAGGMGEVYKARDTRLDRIVAIKVLPRDVATNKERRTRFEREARAIAGLNHPHICTLHDVGDHNGTMYLVMEYIEGETLAARLRKGPLPLEHALRIAAQIAGALAAAHRQGIVHRDLKPGNVMLARPGQAGGTPPAKLLDFGLAKCSQAGVASAHAESLTTQEPATAAGTLLGTVPYMSPEQLEGKEADPRSDIFSFGAILYEMLTGTRAFRGESQASVISAIMSWQPPSLCSLQPVTPPSLDRLVQRCLEKDPEARWQSATDVAAELDWISTGSGSGAGVTAGPVPRAGRSRRWVWGMAAGGVLVALASAALWRWRPATDAMPGPPAEAHQVTFSGDVAAAALSPDHRTIAFLAQEPGGDLRLMVRDVGGGEALEIWRGSGAVTHAWMPDGQQVLVATGFGRAVEQGAGTGPSVWLVPRFGGTARRLGASAGPYLALSHDGSLIATARHGCDYSVYWPASGKTIDRHIPCAYLFGMSWNRRGDELAVVGMAEDGTRGVWIASPADGRARRILQVGSTVTGACWSPVSDALYVERQKPRVTEVTRVTFRGEEVANEEHLLGGLPSSSPCRVSADGQTLVQTRAFSSSNLWRLDLARPGAAIQLTSGTSTLRRPAFSSDGRWVLATLEDRETPELVRVAAQGGTPGPLVAYAKGGQWSPDGRRLAFVSSRTGADRVWVARADGDSPKELPASEVINPLLRWWPDGRLAWQTQDIHNYRIRDLATGSDELLVRDYLTGFVFSPVFSPAGDQVAVFWNRRDEGVWLIGWPDRRERLLARGYLDPIGWSRDGAFVYAARRHTPEIVRVAVATAVVEVVARFPSGVIDETEMCSMAPDHRAITCALTEVKSDAWIVDHFDPHVPQVKR
jgi:Tol biopolymer transport system component